MKKIYSKTAYKLIKKNNMEEEKGFVNVTYKGIKIWGFWRSY